MHTARTISHGARTCMAKPKEEIPGRALASDASHKLGLKTILSTPLHRVDWCGKAGTGIDVLVVAILPNNKLASQVG